MTNILNNFYCNNNITEYYFLKNWENCGLFTHSIEAAILPLIEKKTLLITKAPFAKIWHIFKAKAIAALEKYVSVSTFAR